MTTTKKEPDVGTTKKEPEVATTKKETEVVATKKEPEMTTTKKEPEVVTTKKDPEVVTTKKEPEVAHDLWPQHGTFDLTYKKAYLNYYPIILSIQTRMILTRMNAPWESLAKEPVLHCTVA